MHSANRMPKYIPRRSKIFVPVSVVLGACRGICDPCLSRTPPVNAYRTQDLKRKNTLERLGDSTISFRAGPITKERNDRATWKGRSDAAQTKNTHATLFLLSRSNRGACDQTQRNGYPNAFPRDRQQFDQGSVVLGACRGVFAPSSSRKPTGQSLQRTRLEKKGPT